jgi:hypothetical protein
LAVAIAFAIAAVAGLVAVVLFAGGHPLRGAAFAVGAMIAVIVGIVSRPR